MSDLAVVPTRDNAWLATLNDDEQRQFNLTKSAVQMTLAAKSINAGARAAAALFPYKGFSRKNLSKLALAYRRSGGDDRLLVCHRARPEIKALIDGKKPESRSVLPVEFVEFCGGLFLTNKRSMDAAWRDLVLKWKASWHTGEKINGYGSAREYWRARDPRVLTAEHCPATLPPGWHKSTLHKAVMTWCGITPAELALARRGTAAMRDELPTIHATRAAVNFGEHLFADDLHHDLEVFVNPAAPHERPLEVGLLDYASAEYGPFVTQPTLPMEDGTKRMLGWNCVKFAFGSWLERHGLPLDWKIHIHVERGTATYDPHEAKLVHEISNGIINFCYTEMQGQYCLAWDEKRVGNFRGKAPLESAWGLHHNYEAALPGYVGRSRDHMPALLHGQRKETLALLKWAAQQPAAVRAQLKLPILTYDQFVEERLDIVARINQRTDHQLEAFEKITTWRPQGTHFDYRPLAQLEELPVLARQFVEYQTRLESPAERAARLKAKGRWVACPAGLLAMVYAFAAKPLTCSAGTFHTVKGTSHWWFMHESRAAMAAAGIEDGKEYLVAYNPYDTTCCHIFAPNGRGYLATWPLIKHKRGDQDALAKSIAHRVGLQNEVIAKVDRLLKIGGDTLDTDLRRAHNRQLGAPADLARLETIAPVAAESPTGRDEPPARPLPHPAEDGVAVVTEQDSLPRFSPNGFSETPASEDDLSSAESASQTTPRAASPWRPPAAPDAPGDTTASAPVSRSSSFPLAAQIATATAITRRHVATAQQQASAAPVAAYDADDDFYE